jgi:hypothetical protein
MKIAKNSRNLKRLNSIKIASVRGNHVTEWTMALRTGRERPSIHHEQDIRTDILPG